MGVNAASSNVVLVKLSPEPPRRLERMTWVLSGAKSDISISLSQVWVKLMSTLMSSIVSDEAGTVIVELDVAKSTIGTGTLVEKLWVVPPTSTTKFGNGISLPLRRPSPLRSSNTNE